MESTFITRVISLYQQNKWWELLNFGDCDSNTARSLLWVWPSEENLHFIHKYLIENGCEGITSIGCGCGLFEWFLHMSTGKKLLENIFLFNQTLLQEFQCVATK